MKINGLYYIIISRIKDKGFLIFYIAGFGLYFVFYFLNFPITESSLEVFKSDVIIILTIYFSLISGINGIGIDNKSEYSNILFSKPINKFMFYLSYYCVYLLSLILFLILIFYPSLVLFSKVTISLKDFIFRPLFKAILIISYVMLFSVMFKGNMYMPSYILYLIILEFGSKWNDKVKYLKEILLPYNYNPLRFIIISIAIFLIGFLLFYLKKNKTNE